MIDLEALAEEFNLPKEPVQEVPMDAETIKLQPVNIDNPDNLIGQNISKANALLDFMMKKITEGDFSPRMVEVSAQLINAINGATSQLYINQFNVSTVQLKLKALQLKEKQLVLLENTGGVKNQNIIVTDRETVLKMLRSEPEKEIKRIEYNDT